MEIFGLKFRQAAPIVILCLLSALLAGGHFSIISAGPRPIVDQLHKGSLPAASSEYSENISLDMPPKSWGKPIKGSSGKILFNAKNVSDFKFRLILKGLDKRHKYLLSINGKTWHESNNWLPQKFGKEGYYDFKQIETDDNGNFDDLITVINLKPGNYDTKFFIKDPSNKWKPVLFNDYFIFSLEAR